MAMSRKGPVYRPFYRLVVCLGALGLASCASTTPHAQQPHPQPSAPPLLWGGDAADRARGPLLFEVAAPGGTVHLFGTMHSEPLASVPPAVLDRFASARTVAFEADIEKVDPMKVLGIAMLPASESLDRQIGPEAWKRPVSDRGSPW